MKNTLPYIFQLAAVCLMCEQKLPAAVVFTAGTEEVVAGGNVSVPVSVSGFSDVSAFQFSLVWDTGILTLQNPPLLVSSALDGVASVGTTVPGSLAFLYDSDNSLTLDPNTVIFTMEFMAIGNVGTSSLLSFSDQPTSRVVTFTDASSGTLLNGLMSTIDGSVSVVPEPVNVALGFLAVMLAGGAGIRWMKNRHRLPPK